MSVGIDSTICKWILNKICYLYVIAGILIVSCNPVSVPQREVVSSTLPATLLWQSEVDERVLQFPLLTETAVVVVTFKAIYALDRVDGRQLWKHGYKGDTSEVPIAAIHDTVVYGDNKGKVIALNLLTGVVEWERTIAGKEGYYGMNSIIADQDTVYAASQPTAIEAFDYQDGESKWLNIGYENDIPSRGAQLFLSEDSLYLNTIEVHILNRETGEITEAFERNLSRGFNDIQLEYQKFYTEQSVWDANKLSLLGTLTSPSYKRFWGNCEEFIQPYTITEYIFYGVGMCGGVFEIKEVGNGYEIGWKYFSGTRATAPMALSEKYLYVLFDNGQLHAIDFSSGESAGILKTNLTARDTRSTGSGAVNDGSFIVATFADTNIWAFCETPCP